MMIDVCYAFDVRHGRITVKKYSNDVVKVFFANFNRRHGLVEEREETFYDGLVRAWPSAPWWIRKAASYNRRRNSR